MFWSAGIRNPPVIFVMAFANGANPSGSNLFHSSDAEMKNAAVGRGVLSLF
jgi:hypothetical protein